MLKTRLKKILQFLRNKRVQKRILQERETEEFFVISNFSNDKMQALTEEEKRQVNSLWGQVVPIISYREFEMYKRIYGFDARFLVHSVYLPIVARLLNDYKYTTIFDDKGLLGYVAKSSIKFPYCYVRRIGSDYYNNEMCQISLQDAIRGCIDQDEVFIKPSHDTSGGKGAKKIILRGKTENEKSLLIKKELKSRNNDYVVQECLRQHSVMSQFNPTSINTLRITTLMLNGKFSIGSIVLRCGQEGSSVDNWGAGGIIIMVSPNGKVNDVGYDIHLNEYTQNGTCVFADCVISQIPTILNMIEKAHYENFALCKFIGWDVAINEKEEPVIIELNSSQPGVIGEQLTAGPIFGDRTQEVIDYCKSKTFHY